MSFFRHADLSPDGHWKTKAKKVETTEKLSFPPWVTHRCDESGRVFLASCSPAELACALSAGAFCYTGTPFVNPLSANGQPCLISVSHIRGKVQERLSYVDRGRGQYHFHERAARSLVATCGLSEG